MNQSAVQVASATGSSADFSAASRKITLLADALVRKVSDAVEEIDGINATTRLLALNAQIEASRAGGTTGAAFSVVARAMKDLSEKAGVVTGSIAQETSEAISELQETNRTLRTEVRGTRLADLALKNIDLIDRNLYERSCDVRWWATDSSCVDALANPSEAATEYVSRRLGTILDAYTVYYDIVLCDLAGRVVANGRPAIYESVGQRCDKADWFTAAKATKRGDEFGFQGVHESPLAHGQRALVYSCVVREGGEPDGAALGVLGIIFNWESLARGVIANTPLETSDHRAVRICITDAAGAILADSHDQVLAERLSFNGRELLYRKGTTHAEMTIGNREMLVGHAISPGYETYATGWHSVIMEAA